MTQKLADDIAQLTAYFMTADSVREEVLEGRDFMQLVSGVRFEAKRAWECRIDYEIAQDAGELVQVPSNDLTVLLDAVAETPLSNEEYLYDVIRRLRQPIPPPPTNAT
jgi:hypothetical protein